MNPTLRMMALMALDGLIITTALSLALVLRFEGQIPEEYGKAFLWVLAPQILFTIGAFYVSRLYNRIWSYASMSELLAIGVNAAISSTFLISLPYFMKVTPLPRGVVVIYGMMIILMVGGTRFTWRLYREWGGGDKKATPEGKEIPVLIVGAGAAGAMAARELKSSSRSRRTLVGFIDDDPRKQGLHLLGHPVIGDRSRLAQAIRENHVEEVIIAMPSAPKKVIRELFEACKNLQVKLKILPGVYELLDGTVRVNPIRDVDVLDLLGRDPVHVDLHGISEYLQGKVVVVTGAGGSIGSEICRQIAPFSPECLVLLGRGENSIYEIEMELRYAYPELHLEAEIADIRDKERMVRIFNRYRPHVVFHAAAHKHVPLMEKNPFEAFANNVLGTRNVAEAADAVNTEVFVLISTDKAVNPTSVMGATKRVAEMVVQAMDRRSRTRFAAVRFGNVLGSRGSVIPLFKKQIALGGPVTVTHPDMMRYFMTIPEAVQLVIQAGAMAEGGEVFILDMGEPVKIVDLARDLIRMSGLEPDKDIEIQFVGMRPGEKLNEELLTAEEGAAATRHERIYVARPNGVCESKLFSEIAKVESGTVDGDEVRKVLERLAPNYTGFSGGC